MKIALYFGIIYSIFSEPFRLIAFSAPYDIIFNILTLLVMILFSFEIYL